MSARSIIKDLVPPLVWRTLVRLRPTPVVQPPAAPQASLHTVINGPLQGLQILVNANTPAFAEMVAGTYDQFLWKAMDGEDLNRGLLLDIGAHIGYHSLGLAQRFPQAQVIAFEPNGANQQRIHTNLQANSTLAPRVSLQAIALAERNGTLSFDTSDNIDNETSSGGYLHGASKPLPEAAYRKAGFRTVQVPARRLDDLAREQAWTGIRLLKVDVEGAEHLVLQGALEVLHRDRPLLFMEIHSAVCMLEVLQLLQPLGYRAELLHEDAPGRCFIKARCVADADPRRT